MPTKNVILTGRKTVGTSAVQIYDANSYEVADHGIQVYAADDNADRVYVGSNNSVTADSNDDTDGFPLDAGNSILVPIRRPLDLWAISGTAGQKVWWMVV
jgi:hypothetical protein